MTTDLNTIRERCLLGLGFRRGPDGTTNWWTAYNERGASMCADPPPDPTRDDVLVGRMIREARLDIDAPMDPDGQWMVRGPTVTQAFGHADFNTAVCLAYAAWCGQREAAKPKVYTQEEKWVVAPKGHRIGEAIHHHDARKLADELNRLHARAEAAEEKVPPKLAPPEPYTPESGEHGYFTCGFGVHTDTRFIGAAMNHEHAAAIVSDLNRLAKLALGLEDANRYLHAESAALRERVERAECVAPERYRADQGTIYRADNSMVGCGYTKAHAEMLVTELNRVSGAMRYVVELLDDLSPGWASQPTTNGSNVVLAAIRRLAERATTAEGQVRLANRLIDANRDARLPVDVAKVEQAMMHARNNDPNLANSWRLVARAAIRAMGLPVQTTADAGRLSP